MPFYERGDVRIHYEEVGSGVPLLVTPGGGLNSRVSNWPTAVINAMEAFTQDFRCITMDQRNANGGESSGPIPVDDPWGAFADDQLGLMDHLGIREFCFMGYCIGGPFALKLMQRAPDRVVAGVLCQPVGHRPELPDHMYNGGRNNWAPELLARRPDLTMEGSVPDLLIFLTLPGIYRRVVKLCHRRRVQERNVCDGRRAYSRSSLSGNGCGEIWENVCWEATLSGSA